MFSLSTLSIVVTMHDTQGRMKNFTTWIHSEQVESAQVILVHDGEVSEEFRKLLPLLAARGVEVYLGKFGCPGKARNYGLKMASRKWITFWDFDDRPNLHNFALLIEESTLDNSNVGIGSFNVFELGEESITYQQYLSSGNLRDCQFKLGANIGIWRFIFQTNLIKAMAFCDLRRGEDLVFIAENNILDERITLSSKVVYTYFKGDPRQITNTEAGNLDLLAASKVLFQLSRRKPSYSTSFSGLSSLNCIFGLMRRIIINRELYKTIIFVEAFKLLSIYCIFMPFNVVRLTLHRIRARYTKRHINKEIALFLVGGLGNQLFQLSYLISMPKVELIKIYGALPEIKEYLEFYVKNLGSETFADRVEFIDIHLSKRIELARNISLRMSTSTKANLFRSVIKFLVKYFLFGEKKWSTKLVLPRGVGFDKRLSTSSFASKYVVVGYFQSWKWANTIRDSLISFMDFYKASNLDLRRLSQIGKGLVIQVRRGDYLSSENSKIGVLHKNYFAEALKEIPSQGKEFIYVTSDDPDVMCEFKQIFAGLSSVTLLDNNQSKWSVLAEISMGRSQIISNSTFGWWGAYISKSSKITIVPEPWFGEFEDPCDLIPITWKRIGSKEQS